MAIQNLFNGIFILSSWMEDSIGQEKVYQTILIVAGKEVPLTWTRLSATASAGDTTITLLDPVEWNVDDEIVIATTGDHHTQNENEKKTISAISGDKMTLTLDSALEADHLGTQEIFDGTTVEFRAEVGLLTHNVVVRGNTEPSWEESIEACPDGFNTGRFLIQPLN